VHPPDPENSFQENDWGQKYEELKKFHDDHGHSSVPLGNALGKWVYLQRRLRTENRLSSDKVGILDSLGFSWDLTTKNCDWKDMFDRLVTYKNRNGDCFVPKKYIEDPILGLWVSEQRNAKRERRLNSEEISLLESIGFSWQAKNQCGSDFMVGLRKLESFRDHFNHCDVPENYPADPMLPKFVNAQRAAYEKGKLSIKRIQYLEGMGFEWSKKDTVSRRSEF